MIKKVILYYVKKKKKGRGAWSHKKAARVGGEEVGAKHKTFPEIKKRLSSRKWGGGEGQGTKG